MTIVIGDSLGFTGTQQGMTKEQMFTFYELLEQEFGESVSLRHGDCIGADYQAATIATVRGLYIACHPPINENKRAWFPSDKYYEPKPYLERNHDIVDHSKALVATPKGWEEEVRSGTWATVRYARGKVRIAIIWPSGEWDWDAEQ